MIIFVILLLASSIQLSGQTVIGSESLVSLHPSARWNGMVNFRPGDGEVVDLNPPRFTWQYVPYATNLNSDTEPKLFVFQSSYSNDFTAPIFNITNRYNFYNAISPFTNGNSIWWRIGYIHTLTNTSVYQWVTNSFTISSNAITWDRSMMSDTNYFNSKAIHPYILFNSTNRNALSNWLNQKEAAYLASTNNWNDWDNGKAWNYLKTNALRTVTNSWWPGTKSSDYGGDWAGKIAGVALCCQLAGHNQFSNAAIALMVMAEFFKTNGGCTADFIGNQQYTSMGPAIAMSYDWLYDYLSESNRAYIQNVIGIRSRYAMYGEIFYSDNDNSSWDNGAGDPTGEYTGATPVMVRYTLNKKGGSHATDNFHWSMQMALAAYSENEWARELFDGGLNYMVGRTYAFGDEVSNQGHGYASVHLFETKGLYTHMLYDKVFPEISLNKNPFWNTLGDWWDRTLPIAKTMNWYGWGDTGRGHIGYLWQDLAMGKNLTWFTGNGIYAQHYTNEIARYKIDNHSPEQAIFDNVAMGFYYTNAIPWSNSPTTARYFERDGWIISGNKPANTTDAFTNGIGFIFQSRPMSTLMGHDSFTDMSFELWAYGAMLTDQGSGMNGWAHTPFAYYGLLIDGKGMNIPETYQAYTNYGRILAYSDTADYTYACGDYTLMYPHIDITPGGWLVPTYYSTSLAHSELKHVSKVNRHILFPRKKYWVVFDSMSTTQASTFTWIYHVLENTLTVSNDPSAFYYTATNAYSPTVSVPVWVKHIYQPSLLVLTNLSGNNVWLNPIDGHDYMTNAYAQSGQIYKQANTLWYQSPSVTNWHFMTVIYPQKPGDPAPTITRIDDYTVAVTNGTDGDVISFTNNPLATLRVDLDGMGFENEYDEQTNIAPAVVVQPSSQSVSNGATASFSITASGTSPLTYQWFFNATNAVGTSAASYSFTAATNLAGGYSVVVTNAYGSVTSSTATLTVTNYVAPDPPAPSTNAYPPQRLGRWRNQ